MSLPKILCRSFSAPTAVFAVLDSVSAHFIANDRQKHLYLPGSKDNPILKGAADEDFHVVKQNNVTFYFLSSQNTSARTTLTLWATSLNV